VTLTLVEQAKFGSICIERNCVYLGAIGCTLGQEKPFSCSLYPLSFDPHSRTFSYDSECPVMPAYVLQLEDKTSEASQHLQEVTEEILRLEGIDPTFLKENREVDVDYFDLIKLSHSALPVRSAK
jgi:Fe-S-cluster containining protein